MQGTEIQLVQISQTTLTQWHNSRQKRQELSVLLQGTALPPSLSVAEEPLQEVRVLPVQPAPARQEHQFRLPDSTANQAKKRQTASHPLLPRHILPKRPVNGQPEPFTAPQLLTLAAQTPAPISLSAVPTATVQSASTIPKRPYRRTVKANTCKKCGQYRTADTGHSQYRGRVFCPLTELLPKTEWLEEMKKRFP